MDDKSMNTKVMQTPSSLKIEFRVVVKISKKEKNDNTQNMLIYIITTLTPLC